MRFRFLQISDLHLGGGVSPALELEPAKADRLRSAPLLALERACALAREQQAEAILVPGDLFDAEAVDASTINEAVGLLNAAAPIPVFIAPGNHDYFSADGYYSRDFLKARGRSVWSDHVQIFDRGELCSLALPGNPDVVLTGSCFTGNVTVASRPLARPLAADASKINVLLLHGSREGFGADRKLTCPFSDDELLAQPFDYVALGHYHAHAEIRDGHGTVRAAYAGCPQGRGLDETGEKGALIVTHERVNGERRTELDFHPLARHRIFLLEIDVTGIESATALAQVMESRLAEQGARPADDVVVACLTGRWPRGSMPQLPGGFAERFFHLHVDAHAVAPDYDLDALRREERTVAGAFTRGVLARLEAENDEDRKRVLRNALFYGLDALHEGNVVPRYER